MSLSLEDQVEFGSNGDSVVDNRCRLCGISDDRNYDIFQAPSADKLLVKITTVYPVLIFRDDPLPKMICRKCVFNVGFLYNDIQKIVNIQKNWIDALRSSEPNNSYIKLLGTVQEINEKSKRFIKSRYNKEIEDRLLQDSLYLEEDTSENKPRLTPVPEKKPKTETSASINNFSFDYFEGSNHTNDRITASPALTNCSSYTGQNEETLQSFDSEVDDDIVINELNNLPYDEVMCPQCGLTFNNESLLAVHRMEHLGLSLPKIFLKKLLPKNLRRGRLLTGTEKRLIRCLNCWKLFTDNKEILNHWSLLECEYFCNLCGLEYANNPKELREHCLAAHGVTYRSLKNQRESIYKNIVKTTNMKIPLHQLRDKSPVNELPIRTNALPAPSAKTKQSDIEVKKIIAAKVVKMAQMAKPPPRPEPRIETVVSRKPINQSINTNQTNFYSSRSFDPNTCPICNQRFQNGKARNSHMRIHKPQFGLGEVHVPPNATNDLYATPDTGNHSWQPSSIQHKPKGPTTMSKLLGLNYPRPHNMPPPYSQSPPPLAIPFQSQQPRGVRTKIVPQREAPNMAGPSIPTSIIKVKSLNDLQRSNMPFAHPRPPLPPPIRPPPPPPINTYDSDMLTIKPEPIDDTNSDDVILTSSDYIENDNNGQENNQFSNTSNEMPETNSMSYVKSEPLYADMETENIDEEEDEDDDDDDFFAGAASLSVCDICEKCFINDDDLRLHKTQVHRVTS